MLAQRAQQMIPPAHNDLSLGGNAEVVGTRPLMNPPTMCRTGTVQPCQAAEKFTLRHPARRWITRAIHTPACFCRNS